MESWTSERLIRQYEHYYQITLPGTLIDRYFQSTIHRWRCAQCGLQWFSPTLLGEGDFYEFLGSFPWYYWGDTWDKQLAVDTLKKLNAKRVLELGSGKGQLLRKMTDAGLPCSGVEINPTAIEHATKMGLEVSHADSNDWAVSMPDTIVALQCLEHVCDPHGFLARYCQTPSVKQLVIAVPGTETTLALSSDPLVWPPHHATLWSTRSLQKLAKSLGFETTSVRFQPQEWSGFNRLASLEPNRKLAGLPSWPTRMPGRLLFKFMKLVGFSWAAHAHTVVVTFERQSPA